MTSDYGLYYEEITHKSHAINNKMINNDYFSEKFATTSSHMPVNLV